MDTEQLLSGRYRILHTLGSGGMGTVYRVFDRLTQHEVALKHMTFSSEFDTLSDRGLNSTNSRLTLANEFHILASLHHPHIIRVLDYGFDAHQHPFYTMNLLPQPRTITQSGWKQPFLMKIDLLIQMLQALAYLHRRGVIHRDLKPDNALVATEGEVKVLDFGLAVRGRHQPDEGEPVSGTLAYIAPEVLRGHPASEVADLYAVGIIAYELFTGRHPFDVGNVQKLMSQVLMSNPDMALLEMALAGSDLPAPSTPVDERAIQTLDSGFVTHDLPDDAEATQLLPKIEFTDPDATRYIDKPFVPDDLILDARRTTYFSHPLILWVQRLVSKNPDDRYASAEEAMTALCTAIGQPFPLESAAIRESYLQAARFVGREEELDRLTEALLQAFEGQGSAWLMGGESGVGKSRLLDELKIRALVQGVTVLRGQADPDRGLPYQVWREPLRRLLLTTELNDLDAGILKDLVPDIAQLHERSIPDAATLEATSYQQRLLGTIVSIFQRQTQPILLILEDLQWIGESLEILRLLNGMVTNLPIMIIGAYRAEERPNLPSELPDMIPMRLERLSPESIADLSVSMLGEVGRQHQVIDFLQRETEGNVYFLVEVVRALAEEAGRLENVGRLTLVQGAFAGGIQTVLERRLRRVPDDSQALLQLAAVAGRELDLKLLALVSGDVELDEWLTTCANCAVIEVHNGKWQFVHDKLRQVVLSAIPTTTAPKLHRAIAETIEVVYPDSAEHAAILALHWRKAGDASRELAFVRQAGEHALHISTLADAVTHFERALELLPLTVAVDEDRRLIEADVLLKLGETLEYTGDYERSKLQLEAALALWRELADQAGTARALNLLGNVHWRQGNYAESTRACEESLSLSAIMGDQLTTSRALNRLGMVCFEQGDFGNAAQHFEKSLAIAEALEDVEGRAGASNNLGLVAYAQGNYAEAAGHLEKSLEICRDSGQRRRVASALLNLGGVAGEQGDLDTAIRYFEESLALAQIIGERRAVAFALDNLGFVAVLRSEFASATYYFEESLTIARAIGNRQGVAKTLINLGHVAKGRGDHAEAMNIYYQALEAAHEIDAVPVMMETLVGLAEVMPDHYRAATLLGLIIHHPATFQSVRDSAAPVLEKLKGILPPEEIEAALEQSKTLDLRAVALEALTKR